ncbi:hypothetical protein GV054_01765 [Marinomonas mediterranea]|uniref:hypothetical protein n=1 Tax=Marinomonas mediterranea TaxID=119864 RepID=UPI00234BAB73|nr:hypothetical protein [Marinomonas mediterranea]WCN11835.1 hypothetical protein GV054_01765 [Marinomonas mediterranea]
MQKLSLSVVFITVSLAGCDLDGSGSSSSSSNSSSSSVAVEMEGKFPTGLSVASPLQRSSSATTASRMLNRTASDAKYSMEAISTEIEAVSASASAFSSKFDISHFFTDVGSAECFGPAVPYANHPDGTAGNSGTLPSGDVGIWTETNGSTNEACAAAELNAQMRGAANRTFMSMMSFAGLLAVARLDGVSLPTAGGTPVDLNSSLSSRMPSSISVTTAQLSQSSAGVWSYTLEFEYTDSTPPTGATTPQIIGLRMEHTPGSSSTAYEGVIQYQMDDYYSPSGNCTADTHGGANITHNGSLHYKRNGDNIVTQHRYGNLCGHDQTNFSEAITGKTLQHLSPTSAWDNNFSILTAEFDRTDRSGSYAYTWQAGFGDGSSRILFVGLNSGGNDGESYYGYGDSVNTSTSGDITGLYCNWAGPGTHTLHAYAQRQFLSYSSSSNQYELSSSASSNIRYAPTTSCLYETEVTGNEFRYDRDIDSVLTDETDVTALVYSSGSAPTGYNDLDLMSPTIGSTTYTSIMDAIVNGRHFSKPTYP